MSVSDGGDGNEGMWRVAARAACVELAGCLDLAAGARAPGDLLLANAARERLAGIILAGEQDGARTFLDEDETLRLVFGARERVAALLDLPAAAGHSSARRQGLAASDPRQFLTGLLLCAPQDLDGLTEWLADPRYADILIHYATWQPKCFDHDEDRERYLRYATRFCDACAGLIAVDQPPMLRQLLEHVVATLRCGVIYSCEGDLRDYAEAKGRLLSRFVLVRWPELRAIAPFTDGIDQNRPIRFAMLWNDIDWRTENTVGIAAARHLRAYGFHFMSIIHHRSYHQGGGDAQTISDDLAAACDEVVDLDHLPSIVEKAEAIRALDLDCLFFMNNVTFGFSDYVALATLRLARKQGVNQSAVFTTGFDTIDLYVSGQLSERSPDPQAGYTERLLRVPGTCLIFDKRHIQETAANRTTTLSLRDPTTRTVFASGANLYKIHPALSETWARVLGATPGSRFVLYPFNPNWDLSYPVDRFLRRFRRQLLSHGVDPERVTIAGPWRDAAAVGEVLAACDIYLDSFPHSGGLSSLDALKLGIPVVTLSGGTQRENQSADLIDLIGASPFVTTTVDDYVAMATRLAQDPACHGRYRTALLGGIDDASFYDLEGFSRNLAGLMKEALFDG